jgi:glutaredoxin
MITVYGADWCEDTQRALRHLRRLGVAHHYRNIDEDSQALDRARALTPGSSERRTPIIDFDLGGPGLVEPDNDTLTSALVETQMLTLEDAVERLAVQNVGDLERLARTTGGILLWTAAGLLRGRAKWVVRMAAGVVTLSGVTGWSPGYQLAGVTSIGGPGDRPHETTRRKWFVPSRALNARMEPARLAGVEQA